MRNELGKLAEGEAIFLERIYKRAVLPFLNASVSKAARKCEPRASPFHSSNDVRLKRATTIENWLHEWQLEAIKKNKFLKIITN